MSEFDNEYISIKPPMSLELWVDNSAPTAKPGELIELENYLPSKGALKTRLGITMFGFTEVILSGIETAAAPTICAGGTNTFTDTNCLGAWLFNTDFNDSINGMHFSAYDTTAYITFTTGSGTFVEGTAALSIDNIAADNSALLTLSDTNLVAGFPGKNGDYRGSFSVTFWMQPGALNGSIAGLVTKWRSDLVQRSWGVFLDCAWQTRFILRADAATNVQVTASVSVTQGQWYHVGAVYRTADKTIRLRIWDKTADDFLLVGGTTYVTAWSTYETSSATLDIGRMNGQTNQTYSGVIDEVTVWDRALSDNDIDAIRGFTYQRSTFTADSDCVSFWDWEGVLTDSIGTTHMSAGNGTANISFSLTDYKYGLSSIDVENNPVANSAYLTVTNANLPADFPGKQANANTTMTFCTWFKLESLPPANAHFCQVYNAAAGGRQYRCSVTNTGAIRFVVGKASDGGSSNYIIDSTATVSAGNWYFVAYAWNSASNTGKIYFYNVSSSGWTAETAQAGAMYSGTTEPFIMLNGTAGGTQQIDGKLDMTVMFKDYKSDADLDLIRQGTYS